jgi:tetratricopeptide (TPR) repeat protein
MGPKIEAIQQGFARFPEGLYGSLELVPGVPTELLELVERESPRFEPGFDIAEVEIRKRVIQTLIEFGASEKDQHEPSLAVLGQLLLDVGFVQSVALLDYQTRSRGVDVDGSIPTHRSIATGHPYALYLETYASDPARVEVALKQLVESLTPEALGNPERVMINKVYFHLNKSKYSELVRYVDRHADPSLRELYTRSVSLDQKRYGALIKTLLGQLRKSCPNHPLTAMLTIRYDWPKAEPHAADWEDRFNDHPLVLFWLSQQYESTGDFEGTERCLTQGLKIAPDADSYQRLAATHHGRGDFKKWKNTLDEMFLRTEAEGLEHAHARNRIARYLMRQQEFDEALPYAESAADTYAAWGLECLSACYEGLNRLEESESLLQAAANRYDSSSLSWLEWCLRNGQGDHEAARRASLEFINGFSSSPSSGEMRMRAQYYLFTGDLKQSLENFQKVWKADKAVDAGIMAAILADQLKRHDVRDGLLKQMIKHRDTLDEDS